MDYNSNSGSMMHKDDDFDGYVSHNSSGSGSHLPINKNGMSKAELRKVGLSTSEAIQCGFFICAFFFSTDKQTYHGEKAAS